MEERISIGQCMHANLCRVAPCTRSINADPAAQHKITGSLQHVKHEAKGLPLESTGHSMDVNAAQYSYISSALLLY